MGDEDVDAEEDDGEGAAAEQETAATAQRERLSALEQQAAPTPTPSAAPVSSNKKPPVSAFARRGGRYHVAVTEGHSGGVAGLELLGNRGS